MVARMSDIIEAMARAIYESHRFVRPWDDPRTQETHGYHCRESARAAFAALAPLMREPSEAMRRVETGWLLNGECLADVWRAMVGQLEKEVMG